MSVSIKTLTFVILEKVRNILTELVDQITPYNSLSLS